MNLNTKVQTEKFSQFNLRIDRKNNLNKGDLVKLTDGEGNAIEYAYLITNIYYQHGYPFVTLKTQRTDKTLEMVVTNAIQKV